MGNKEKAVGVLVSVWAIRRRRRRRRRARTGVQNQKQEPHTKMWGNTIVDAWVQMDTNGASQVFEDLMTLEGR